MKKPLFVRIAGLSLLATVAAAQETPNDAPHALNMAEAPEAAGPSSDAAERAQLEASGDLFPLAKALKAGAKATTPNIKPGGVVLGYAQSYSSAGTYVDFYNWDALTHIASTFVSFDGTGAVSTANENVWKNRDANLKAGGAAQAAGTKVLLTMLNSGFDVTVINNVMTSATARTTLINEIVALLQTDGYSHGVTFDFEPFSWSASATTGMTSFFAELRAALNSHGMPNHTISVYADPNPSTTRWKMSAQAANLDYLFFSGYDYATGTTPHAITDYNSSLNGWDIYFDDPTTAAANDGLAPEKFVYVISSYSGRWANSTAYNSATSPSTDRVATGFTDALYDTTLRPTNGGPFTDNYVTGDEVSWYTYNNGTNQTVTWDSPKALNVKLGAALAYPGTGTYQGRRLGGVGFWSMMWMAETTSREPNGATDVAKTRTYPQILQLCEEILKPAGQQNFLVTGFEGLNFRWRDPNESPDSSNAAAATARAIVAAPTGAGRPASTNNAMQLTFNLTGAGSAFLRHEMLANTISSSVMDTNAVISQFDSSTQLTSAIYTPASYSNATVRMIVMDSSRQLEMSPAFTLNATGWRNITWDLTNPATVSGHETGEAGFLDGNGVINTAGGGKKDIAFVGFLVESTSAVNGVVDFDEVTYTHANFGGQNYKINEVRYDGADGEFVEIFGPVGALPAGFQVHLIDGTTGTINAVNVSGTVPADGHFVVGDPSVPNVDFSTGFAAATGELSDNSPSAVQLYDSVHGAVYDSFVYEAMGGLGELTREQMLGVAGEGYPWFGRIATGTDTASVRHSAGRYPDGADTNINAKDFSLMKATPGAANGGTLTAATTTTFNFTTAPTQGFASFATFTTAASGVGASPSGGNVHRCVDTSGGGILTFLGDKALGADGNGYEVTGEIFIPNSSAPTQAIGIGICGGQGSTFFSTSRVGGSYENGYWLIYESNATATLDDGIANHAGKVHFVRASHDNMDGSPVESLGNFTVGGIAGTWTTFYLAIDPHTGANGSLVARLGGNLVYSGAIPAGGPTSGPVMFGFREFDGTVSAAEGTWVDNVVVKPVNVAAKVSTWTLY